MSRTFHHGERRIRVHGVRKDPPDLRRLAKALIELARTQAETEAQGEHADHESKVSQSRAGQKRDRKHDRGDRS